MNFYNMMLNIIGIYSSCEIVYKNDLNHKNHCNYVLSKYRNKYY